MRENAKLLNYVNGNWVASTTADYLAVVNPATQETLAGAQFDARSDDGRRIGAVSFNVLCVAYRRDGVLNDQPLRISCVYTSTRHHHFPEYFV